MPLNCFVLKQTNLSHTKWDACLNSNLLCALVSEADQLGGENLGSIFKAKNMWFRKTKTISNIPSVNIDITNQQYATVDQGRRQIQ